MEVYSPLEITIKSATDLENVNHALKMEVCAVVSICGSDNYNLNSTEQRTPVDTDGHSNPKWNFFAKFNIDIVAAQQNQLALVIKLKSVNLSKPNGEDDIGEVNVPIKNLLDTFGHAEEDEKNVSYPVKTMAGALRGELIFSFKLGKPSSTEYQHVVRDPGYYGFLHSVYTVPPHAAQPPHPLYGPTVPPPYPPYGLAAPRPYPPYGPAAPRPYPPCGLAAPSPYPPYGPAAPPPYPLYGHAAPPPYPPYGQAAPPPYPVPYGQAAPPPYPVAHEQTAPQMQPQNKPNLLAQLGIGVAAAVLSGAAQVGIGALFSG
ncbi:protein SRC2 homolog [Quercus robur]|uniref:protein SRC2 homolog n=1 Tax=Quercus robur TaxID=38942 RepID=UPI002163EA93|nr:protein SRC2 homolog [Quercus robur]